MDLKLPANVTQAVALAQSAAVDAAVARAHADEAERAALDATKKAARDHAAAMLKHWPRTYVEALVHELVDGLDWQLE